MVTAGMRKDVDNHHNLGLPHLSGMQEACQCTLSTVHIYLGTLCVTYCVLRPPPIPCLCRYEQLLTLVHSVNGASLLVGGPGTAKTTVINQFLGKFNSEVWQCVLLLTPWLVASVATGARHA
jgi:hypothetical protein